MKGSSLHWKSGKPGLSETTVSFAVSTLKRLECQAISWIGSCLVKGRKLSKYWSRVIDLLFQFHLFNHLWASVNRTASHSCLSLRSSTSTKTTWTAKRLKLSLSPRVKLQTMYLSSLHLHALSFIC